MVAVDRATAVSAGPRQLAVDVDPISLHHSAPRAVRRRRRWMAAVTVASTDLVALLAVHQLFEIPFGVGLATVAGTIAVLLVSRTYQLRLRPRVLQEAPRLLALLVGPVVVAAITSELLTLEDAFGRQLPLMAAALLTARALSYAWVLRSRRRQSHETAVIVGAGRVGRQLRRVLDEHPEHGLEVLGFVDGPDAPVEARPLLGRVEDLHGVLTRHDPDRVLVAFGPTRETALVGALRVAVQSDRVIHVVPRFFDLGLALQGARIDDVHGIPLFRLRKWALGSRRWRAKRLFDVILAAVAFTALAPVMAAIAVGVKRASPGPVLFRQQRIGQGGTLFELLKFRSMPVQHEGATTWSVADDRTIPPFGRLIRRASIDELPQLWNVLRGDMSLIGPRPERPHFADQFSRDIDGYRDRHRLPVGMTGWAQVHQLRGDTSIADRARFDNWYIDNWSLWLDATILLRSVGAIVRDAVGEGR